MNILHDEVYVVFVMKSFDKTNNIRKNDFFKNFLLGDDCVLHFLFLDILLVETFYGVEVGSELNVFY